MITITNNNIYRSDFSISELPSLDNTDIIDAQDVIKYLSDDVELGESLTFKRLFDIVADNVEKFNEIFHSSLGGYPLGPYLQEIENNPTELFNSEYLELYWGCDQYEDELSIYPSLHGISTKEDISYAMDFVSLNNIKFYNIKLNKKVELFTYNVETKESSTQLLGNKNFTLFDLYHGIFNEISFHGGPQDKKERLSELEESLNEAEEEMKMKEAEDDGLMSFEEMLKKHDSQDKYLVKYKELRYRVDKDRISNKKNLKKLKNCLLEKLKIYDIIENSDDDLSQYYKKLTHNEYDMQLLYGEEEDIIYHRFWETPKCTCPKIDNLEIYPSNKPFFDKNCQIHKKPL